MIKKFYDILPADSAQPVPTGERMFSWNQIDFILSMFVCEFAPHHSAIESPGQFVNRAIEHQNFPKK